MRILVSNIEYDTEGEMVEGLPEMTIIEFDDNDLSVDIERRAVDKVSEATDWLVASCTIEVLVEVECYNIPAFREHIKGFDRVHLMPEEEAA